jgi:hypothetical protein
VEDVVPPVQWGGYDEEMMDTEEALGAGTGELSGVMMVKTISQYVFILHLYIT